MQNLVSSQKQSFWERRSKLEDPSGIISIQIFPEARERGKAARERRPRMEHGRTPVF